MTNEEIGFRIASRRKEIEMRMDDLAKRVGVANSTIQRYEAGKIAHIKMPIIESIANALGVNPNWIIGKSENKFSAPDNISPMQEIRRIPLLGSAVSGSPIPAEKYVEDYVDLPYHIHADFALICKGDSMINARIYDGDVVYIQQQDAVNDGEIAAVLIEDKVSLKRIYSFPDHIILISENPMHKPAAYWNEEMNEVKILGKAVAFTSAIRY